MRVLSVVGNRPQFIKSAPLSVALRGRGIEEVLVHTGQHYDPELSAVFFEELGLPDPHVRLDLHTADVAAMTQPIADGVEGRVEVVGDVMADATMQFTPIARRRSRLLSELELTPGRYVVATVHREANTRPELLARIVEGLNGLTEPVVFPVHPRTSGALERDGLTLHEHVLMLPPLGYLDFAALAG